MFERIPFQFKTLLPLIFLLGACIEAKPFEASEDVTASPDVVATSDATEPDATEPDATEPDATEPDATEPDATEPDATEPDATEPDATEPDATEPDATPDTTTDTAADAPCESTCGDKECGEDGCGGVCGQCSDDKECNDEGYCDDPCVADCEGKECGDDGCGGACGSGCPQELPVCTQEGLCEEECTPDCADKTCGADGCGGLCGGGSTPEGCYASKPYCNAQQMCQEACPEECPQSCTEDGSTCLTQVTFQFDASCNPGSPDTIEHVWVVGSFYTVDDLGVEWMDWPEYVLTKKPNGIHTGVFWLPFGEHAYKFVTSNTEATVEAGTWENLSADLECVDTAGGYTNRVLPITSTDPIMLPVVSKESCGPCGSCTPDCSDKDCGDDGCGGVCGACANGSFCDGNGICKGTCESDEDCNDGDPCTSDECNEGSCAFLSLSPGTPCWVNAWCNGQGQCDGSPTQHQRHLASGHYHNCSVFVTNVGENSGQVKCWGNGSHGQLGQGTTTSIGGSVSALPADFQPIPLEIPAVAVAVGYLHSCALLQNGWLKCWGHAAYGQLGQDLFLEDGTYKGNIGQNADDMQGLAAIDLGSENGNELLVEQVVAGSGFTCALLDTGRVKCFGLNDMGQLGNGTTENSANVNQGTVKLGDEISFVKVGNSPLENVSKIFAGKSHACAINSNGYAYCWGDNSDFKLGAGLSLNNDENYVAKAHLVGLSNTKIYDLFLSERHTCALVSGGSVKCWGYGGQGALGYESSGDMSDSLANMMYLAPVELGEGVVAQRLIQGAAEHTCAVVVNENPALSTQQLKCWGHNYAGKLGLGLPATNAGSPNNIGDQSGEMGGSLPDLFLAEEVHVLEVSGGANHTCALLETIEQGQKKGIKCWGHNGPSGKTGATAQPEHWILGVSAEQMGDKLPWVNLGWPDAKWINDLCEQDLCAETAP